MTEEQYVLSLLGNLLKEIPYLIIAIIIFFIICRQEKTNEFTWKEYFKNFKLSKLIKNPLAISSVISIILYFCGCLITWQMPNFKMMLMLLVFVLLTVAKVLQPNDFLAFVTIFFISAFAAKGQFFTNELNIAIPIGTFVTSYLLFLPKYTKVGIIEKKWKVEKSTEKKTVYMSEYLAIGYLVTSIIYILFQF